MCHLCLSPNLKVKTSTCCDGSPQVMYLNESLSDFIDPLGRWFKKGIWRKKVNGIKGSLLKPVYLRASRRTQGWPIIIRSRHFLFWKLLKTALTNDWLNLHLSSQIFKHWPQPPAREVLFFLLSFGNTLKFSSPLPSYWPCFRWQLSSSPWALFSRQFIILPLSQSQS